MNTRFLIGGGWNEDGFKHTYGRFVNTTPPDGRKILIIAVAESKDAETRIEDYYTVFTGLGLTTDELVALVLTPSEPLTLQMIEEIQPTGIFVCGGTTPLYQEALCINTDWLEYVMQENIPYAGFSAGAAIASPKAIVGGWQIDVDGKTVAILDEELAEDLDALEVRSGLDLIPFAVDVHASQWGTISRLIHAVDQGMVDNGWAIDEDTMLEVTDDMIKVHGLGQAYFVERLQQGEVKVQIYRAGASLQL